MKQFIVYQVLVLGLMGVMYWSVLTGSSTDTDAMIWAFIIGLVAGAIFSLSTRSGATLASAVSFMAGCTLMSGGRGWLIGTALVIIACGIACIGKRELRTAAIISVFIQTALVATIFYFATPEPPKPYDYLN